MSNQYLKLRRSAIPGKKPDTGSLQLGEIALNTYDGLVFMKRSGSAGEEIISIGSSIPTGSFAITGSNTFIGNQTVTGSVDITGSLTVNTINVGQNTINFIDENGIIVNSLSISSGSNNITLSTGSIQTISDSFFSGSFKGDGSGLTNISASAVIGLNLSQITSGSYSASISNDQLLVNTGVNAPSFTGSLFGTASYADNAESSSYASSSTSASYAADATNAQTASYASSGFAVDVHAIYTASITNASIAFLKGGGGTFSLTVDNVQNAETASYAPNYLPLTGGTITGSLTVSSSATFLNGITVYGSSSFMYITSSQLAVSASTISVNVFEPVERFGGLIIYDSGSSSATASLLWDSQNNHFIYQNVSGAEYSSGMFIAGPKNNGALGNEQGINTNALTKGQGGDHITSSQITDDGTTVTIPGNLSVTNGITGSLFGIASTSSYVNGSIFDSNNLVLSASHALTASFALNGGGGGGSPFYYQTIAPETGSEPITGSMWVSSDTGVEYNLIYDGDSYQWVQQTLPVGPQGPQGVSGTNNIDTLTTTTLVGLLGGDGVNVSATTVSQSLGYIPEDVANKSTDGTFASNSDTLYPSQKAVKTYVDNNGNFADEVDYAMIMQQRYFFNI